MDTLSRPGQCGMQEAMSCPAPGGVLMGRAVLDVQRAGFEQDCVTDSPFPKIVEAGFLLEFANLDHARFQPL